MHENINRLVQQIRVGDKSACKKLYDEYESYWFRLCLRYGRNRDEGQDMFQEGVVRIFQMLHKFDEQKGNFTNWSSRVLINEALKYLKKYQWQQSFDDLEVVSREVDDSMDILDQISAKELIQVIQQLPSGYRLVFNMYEMEGYSHKEIAQTLGISLGTSKSQLSKAKSLLRKQLSILMQ